MVDIAAKSSPCCLFSTIGIAITGYLALRLLFSIWNGLKAYVLSSEINFRKLGEWAVVTGATDGIGKCYAFEFAKRGLNICLISRTPKKLEEVAAEIEKTHNVKTKTVAVDFTAGNEIYDKIERETQGLDVGVLVNNVGMSYEYPQFMAEMDDSKNVLQKLLLANCMSILQVTNIFLKTMVEKKKGAIINLSSASANDPTPLLTAYSACKSFVNFFSQGLEQEVSKSNVIVQSVLPYFVQTKMTGIKRPSLFVPSPTAYVKSALRTVGVEDVTFGYWSHALLGYFQTMAPDFFAKKQVMGKMLAARKSALRRKEKSKQN
ncbi:DgyrCDS10526 [Dimorphilus gyrociliatus]|uniref:DgyrCDS10526 n=1 Tax=Dimorphilus gyrociliatus TaxID=2664684 RepID=A0A7I8W5K6_9ANNE|nr:DgyrCDS10526 [Dimorphilus gyrociliatus]